MADGNSEMYYGMAAFIPAYFVIGSISGYETPSAYSQYRCGLENGIKISVCCLGAYFFLYNPYGEAGAIDLLRTSIKSMDEIAAISSSDMDGLLWLRDNSEEDAVVVSDSAVMTGTDTCYYYGIGSERQQYIEGVHMLRFGSQAITDEIQRREELVIKLYNNDFSVIEKLREDGVDYMVQTVTISPQFKPDDKYLELMASSANINVYKIR